MKRKARLAVAILLLLALATPVQAATVKAGSKCTKAGATATASGKKFLCIKSGKKLVWNKGVAVKAAPKPDLNPVFKPVEPIPTPTPVATPTPTPSPTPTPTAKTLTPLEKLNTDIYQRYVVAQKNISPSFNFVRCPNANKEMAEITEKAYIDAYAFYVPIYKATAKVNWLLMSEKDWNCWYDTTAIFEGPNSASRSWNVWNKDTGILGHCNVSATAFCGYGTGVREGGVFAQYNLFGTNYKIAPTALTVHHETVHIYQSQVMSDNYQTSKTNTAACWFIEGQANLFGAPIATKGDPSVYRNSEIKRLLNVYPQGRNYTKEQWLAVFNDLKNSKTNFCFEKELGYSLGWFALEWTYLNYSIEEMHNFLEAMAKGSTWEQAIQLVLKMDEQTYYGKIAQYFADEF
jgi:hypothetical protein